jgi:hypothetical protein
LALAIGGLLVIAAQMGAVRATSTESAAGESMTWTMNPSSPAFDHATTVADMAITPDGVAVIVGSAMADDFPDAAAWSSAGGVTWEQGSVPLKRAWRGMLAGGSALDGVIASPSGLLAVGGGFYGQPPGLVASSVDGRTWIPQLGGERVHYSDVAAVGSGMITVGTEARRRSSVPIAWRAAAVDAGTWDEARIADAGQATHVQVAPDGIQVSAGYVVSRRGSAIDTPVWRRVDDSGWTAVELDVGPEGRISGLAWTPLGFLLAYQEGPVWISSDGLEWERTLEVEDRLVTAVGVIGDDLVAFGTDRMWLSSDGMAWSEIEEPTFEGYWIRSFAELPEGDVLAVGSKVVPDKLEVDVATFVGTRQPRP